MVFDGNKRLLLIMANRLIGPGFAIIGFTLAAFFLLTEAIPIVREFTTTGIYAGFGLVTIKVFLPMTVGWLGLKLMTVRRFGFGDEDIKEKRGG